MIGKRTKGTQTALVLLHCKRPRRASNLPANLRQFISARRGLDLQHPMTKNAPSRICAGRNEMLRDCCNHSVSHRAVLRIKTV